MDLELYEFEDLTQASSLLYTLDVTSCVRDTKASGEYIFKGASIHPYIHTSNTSVNSNSCEII